MRLLMISDFYHPYLGGVEQHVRSLSQALSGRGHEVAVATLASGSLPPFERDGDVAVHRLPSSAGRASFLFKNADRPWAAPLPDPEASRALGRLCRSFRPQIVHGHDWLARSFLPRQASSGARLIISLHYYTQSCAKKSLMRNGRDCAGPGPLRCPPCASAHYGLAKGPAVAAANWLGARAERRAVDAFIAVSRATASGNGLAENDGRLHIIPNFLPDAAAGPAEVEPYLARLPAGEFLLFVGDLRPEKGIETLLAAYERLQYRPPLVLIGKRWPESPASLPPGAVFHEKWPNAAVRAAFGRCAIAVVPSRWAEPFGIVVIEALAAGAALVASSAGGIPEIITHGHNGLLTPPGDEQALAKELAALLADPARREQLGANGRLTAQGYTASAVTPRIEAVYEAVLGTTG
jgi:glycosyltransferase involved in cell wall biosynthesis